MPVVPVGAWYSMVPRRAEQEAYHGKVPGLQGRIHDRMVLYVILLYVVRDTWYRTRSGLISAALEVLGGWYVESGNVRHVGEW